MKRRWGKASSDRSGTLAVKLERGIPFARSQRATSVFSKAFPFPQDRTEIKDCETDRTRVQHFRCPVLKRTY